MHPKPTASTTKQTSKTTTSSSLSEPISSKVQSAKEKIAAMVQRHSPSLSLTDSTSTVSSQAGGVSLGAGGELKPLLVGKLSFPRPSARVSTPSGNKRSGSVGVLLDSSQFEQMHMVFVQ
jgi:hypothetical protein